MNANVPMLDEFAGRNTKEVIRMLNETIRQQQAEIEALKADNELMCKALVRATRAILRKANQHDR